MFARTERLLLRPGWKEDAPALLQAICDERIVCNLAQAPWPYSFADAESFLTRERRPTEVSCLVYLRTMGAPRLAGAVGIGLLPSGEHEFGYWIARPFWGLGFATEAGRAIIANARHSLRLERLSAGHYVDNPASGRVLAKLGFRPTGVTALRFSAGRGAEAPCKLFERDLTAEDFAEGEAQAMAA